ncbi:uncharacterized protein LOC143104899 [Alosa pseudoharengus]|uniref:uncharacterized protein LOC143104899 n=1 Tax=Alosa pseudoharengus TaxID=34774 RepID=UPI003F88AD58
MAPEHLAIHLDFVAERAGASHYHSWYPFLMTCKIPHPHSEPDISALVVLTKDCKRNQLTDFPGERAYRASTGLALSRERPALLRLFVDKEANTYKTPSCQLSLTGEELMRWSGLVTLPAIVKMNGYAADKPSQSVSVTVKETHAAPSKPHLKISPAVLRESSTVQMTCEVPQSQSASLCLFYLDGIEAAPYSHPSCQMSLSGVQILQWTRQSSPLEAKVGCNYLIEGERTPSDHSDYVSLTVLDRLQKPNIKVLHDGFISIVCDIPKHFGEATDCQLYTGDKHQFYLKTKTSKSASGDQSCQFTVNKDDLFRRLQSMRSRGVSCDYTVNTEPPSLSPRSDPYNFKGLSLTTRKAHLPSSQPDIP